MASGRIIIPVGLETRGVAKGAKDAEKALEDLEDAVKDTGTGGARDLDKIEDELKDVQSQSKKTGRDIGREMDDGFDKAKKGADDFKDEANSTAKEAAASFDGSAESIADAFQEISANAFSGFGPAGAVAGLAAAAGIGLVVAGFQAADEARQQSEERVAEWADSFIEAGGKALSAGVMAARAQEIITDPEKFKKAEENHRLWGVSIETAIAAMTGNEGALRDVKAAVGELADEYEDASKKAPIDEYGQINGQLIEQEQAYRDAARELDKLTGEMDTGRQRAQIMNRYYEDLINSTSGVTREVDELGNELYSLPDGTQVYVDAETKQASQNVSKFKGDLDKVPETVTSTVRLRVDSSAWDRWQPHPKTGRINTRATGGREWI